MSKIIFIWSEIHNISLLNFFYLVRYGGVNKAKKLTELYGQCISSGKGSLGIRIMFYFYWKQLFINIINKRSNDFVIDIKTYIL